LLYAGGDSFVQWVLQAYQREVGSNFWQRLAFYHKIVPFYTILYGAHVGDETRIRDGLDELERNLDD